MRKIIAVTSSRADYGILKPLLTAIKEDGLYNLQIAATGSHLEKKYGNTIDEIIQDGFNPLRIESKLKNTQANSINHSIGKLIGSFSDCFTASKPNLVLLLGDRYEILAAAIAAYVLQIPLAHIHGGETSAGAFDEGFRHSITKLSSLHFVICEAYKNRVIQLGENPSTVFNVGALAVDNIQKNKLLKKEELENAIQFQLDPPTALITYHPVTLEKKTSLQHLQNLFEALNNFPELRLIFNKSNADTDGDLLNKALDKFIAKRPNAIMIPSLGMNKFLSTLNQVQMMIGNSSAGIIEMPYFKKPTVNIGNRQNGRFKALSVIDCGTSTTAIERAIESALSKSFNKQLQAQVYPFGNGNAANKILQIIKKEINHINLKKDFHDLKF